MDNLVEKYKGNLTLRVPPELHKALVIKSLEQRVSVNSWDNASSGVRPPRILRG